MGWRAAGEAACDKRQAISPGKGAIIGDQARDSVPGIGFRVACGRVKGGQVRAIDK